MKPILQFLSDEEIQTIHKSALQILSSIGMHLPHDEALELMSQNGAEIVDGNVVRISNKLIDAAIESVPKRKDVTLFGRDPKHDVSFEKHDPALACMTMAVNVIDPYTRKKRPATNDDLAALTRIADQLENIRVSGGLVTPQEVPGEFNDWYTWATTIKNTTKHITGGMLGARCVQDAAKMGAIALGDEELFRGLIADLMDGMQLDMDLVVDFPDLIFCDDCMAAVRRMAATLVIDEDTLALETMKDVGPGGTFLSQDHTFQHFRQELWMPRLLERRNWDLWEKDGAMDIFKVAERRLHELLAADPEPLLPTEVQDQIDEVVRKAQDK